MKHVSISNKKLTGLFAVLKHLATLTLPMKFTIARNLKSIEPQYEAYTEEKDALHKKSVLVDDKGENVIKEQFVEFLPKMQVVPYEWFEYGSEEEEKEFFDALTELNDREVEIALHQEDLNRKVKVKLTSEKSESYETLTLEQILEDPSTQIGGDAIAILLEYEILK
jgi:hypothetical protein